MVLSRWRTFNNETNWAAIYQLIHFISAESIKIIYLLNRNDNTVLNLLCSLALRPDSNVNKQNVCIKIGMACKNPRSWKVSIDVFHRGKQGQVWSMNDHFVSMHLKIN